MCLHLAYTRQIKNALVLLYNYVEVSIPHRDRCQHRFPLGSVNILSTSVSVSSGVDAPLEERFIITLNFLFRRCAQCEKSFSHPRLLILHMRVHPAKTNLMPKNSSNKCVDCGETFPSNDLLKTHIMENHEQNLPYKCPVCSKDFSEVSHLLI